MFEVNWLVSEWSGLVSEWNWLVPEWNWLISESNWFHSNTNELPPECSPFHQPGACQNFCVRGLG